ncbi:MAG TPA: class I SAM-dependent methyltransferase [Stellaceae bacterium]|nr:class I SAM-dependent methyltransferase [Stellaceae bacterium]
MAEAAYEFSEDWFSANAPIWAQVFPQLLPNATKLLEIGSYEGRSTVWMMEHALAANTPASLFCIDTWQGGIEHDRAAMPVIEARFDRNVALAKAPRPWLQVHKIKSPSRLAMAKLIAEGHGASFDFIYVDGGHHAFEVLGDLVLAFDLCRRGGVIVCDDYLWDLYDNPLATPKIGIDAFVNCYAPRVKPLNGIPLYQLWLRKLAD